MTQSITDPYPWLAERGVPQHVAELVSPEPVGIGIRFRLPVLGGGEPFEQTLVRDDLRDTPMPLGGTYPKYLSEAGRVAVWCPVPRPGAPRVLIVEGTKGHLAAAAYAPDDVEVWGLAGCQNWGHDGVPCPELAAIDGREAIISFDGDVTRNADIWTAARGLADTLTAMGATSVTYQYGVLRGKAGMDDYLATFEQDARPGKLAGLIGNAKASLGKCPARRAPEPEPGEADVDADELSVAKAYAKHFGGMVRWDATAERWLVYAGVWNTDGATAAARRFYHLLIDGMVRPVGTRMVAGVEMRHVESRWARSRAVREAVLSMAAAEDPVTHFGTWDADPYLFALRTGTLDLRTGAVRDSDPADHITRMSPVEYDPDAAAPEFERFLSEALPDPDVRGYLQRVLGMAMLGVVREHVLPVLVGEGRNGKGTLLRIVLAAFGSYGTGVNRNLLIEQRNPGHLTELMTLKGKRLAVTQETSQGARWDVTRINTLTGGDEITARGMHENEQTFKPSHTLMLATNHRPAVEPGESAFWSRYREIPFTVSFEGREDPELDDRIIASELPGVLRWLIDGYTAYRRDGLAAPMAVQLADLGAKIEANAFGMFVTDTYEITGSPTDVLTAKSIWDSWLDYRRMDPSAATSRPNRVQDLPKALASLDRRIERGGRTNQGVVLCGLRLIPGGRDGRAANGDANPPDGDAIVLPTDAFANANTPQFTSNNTENGAASDASDANLESSSSCENIGVEQDQDIDTSSPGLAQKGVGVTGVTGSTPVVIDIEGPSTAARWDDRAEGYVHLVGLRTASAHVDTAEFDCGPTAGARAAAHLAASSPLVITHNGISFDLPALARQFPDAGIDVLAMARQRRLLDTMVADATLNPPVHDGRPGFVERAMAQYSLDASCARHGMPGKTDDLPALADYHGGFDRIPVRDPAYRSYLAGDTQATWNLALDLLPSMTPYAWREQHVAAIASVITDTGIMINRELTEGRHLELAARRAALKDELVQRYGIPTLKADGKSESSNPAATKAGKAALIDAFVRAGVAQPPRTATGELATGREAMDELIEAQRGNQAVIDLATVVKDMSGLRTVYGTALDTVRGDGACHPGVAFFQASGRWSLTKPGMTVYGKRGGRVVEREIFVPRPGTVFIAADLAQIDARAIAVHSQDPAYMALFEPGVDSHVEVAKMVWGDPGRRQDAKAIGHGYNYGMGIDKLASTAKVPIETAVQFDRAMIAMFPRLVTWKDWIREQAKTGEPLDNGFGRKLYVDPKRTYTQAPALMGQGTARDLMAETLIHLPDEVARMLRIQVHDEAVFEVPVDRVDEISAIIHTAMNFEWAPMPDMRPIQITAEVGKPGVNWADCYA